MESEALENAKGCSPGVIASKKKILLKDLTKREMYVFMEGRIRMGVVWSFSGAGTFLADGQVGGAGSPGPV